MSLSALRAAGGLLLMCVHAGLPVRAAPVRRTFSLGPFGSLELGVRVRTIHGPECVAHYVSITDRAITEPTQKNFRYGTQGAAAIGRLLVTLRSSRT